MRKVIGNSDVRLLECTNPVRDKWRVRWNVVADEDTGTAEYMEEDFDHKPTVEEVKELITGWYNEQTNKKIVSGFQWKGMPVWLSTENQSNYMSAYTVAMQTNGANLPVTFKFGTDNEPVYRQFDEMATLSDFCVGMNRFIQGAVEDGWEQKNAVLWEEYIKCLE